MPLPRGAKPKLEPPDPYLAGAAFLGWLAKQGGDEELSVCEYQWELNKKNHPTPELEDVDLYEYVKSLGLELIVRRPAFIELTPKGGKWATNWAIAYGVDRGHHGGFNLRKY